MVRRRDKVVVSRISSHKGLESGSIFVMSWMRSTDQLMLEALGSDGEIHHGLCGSPLPR